MTFLCSPYFLSVTPNRYPWTPNASSKDAVRWLRPGKLGQPWTLMWKHHPIRDHWQMKSCPTCYCILCFWILESSSKIWDRVKVHAPNVLPFRREESGGFCSEAEPCGTGGHFTILHGTKWIPVSTENMRNHSANFHKGTMCSIHIL